MLVVAAKEAFLSILQTEMMRAFLTISFIAILSLPTILKVWILVDFKIHQDYIAEVLCINRDEPITMCNGSCYLKDRLQEAEEKEQEQIPEGLKQKVEILYLSNLVMQLNDFFDDADSVRRCPLNNESYHSSYHGSIFHPPKFS